MKVLYDHQIFSMQRYGGISRYYYELIKNIYKSVDSYLALKFSNNEYILNKTQNQVYTTKI